MTDKPKPPETPGMAEVSAKFVAEAEAAVEASTSTDEALSTLWQEHERLRQQYDEATRQYESAEIAQQAITETETPEHDAAATAAEDAGQRQQEASDAVVAAENRMAKMPARTVAGVLLKLRVAGVEITDEFKGRDGVLDESLLGSVERLTLSALADLERLAGNHVGPVHTEAQELANVERERITALWDAYKETGAVLVERDGEHLESGTADATDAVTEAMRVDKAAWGALVNERCYTLSGLLVKMSAFKNAVAESDFEGPPEVLFDTIVRDLERLAQGVTAIAPQAAAKPKPSGDDGRAFKLMEYLRAAAKQGNKPAQHMLDEDSDWREMIFVSTQNDRTAIQWPPVQITERDDVLSGAFECMIGTQCAMDLIGHVRSHSKDYDGGRLMEVVKEIVKRGEWGHFEIGFFTGLGDFVTWGHIRTGIDFIAVPNDAEPAARGTVGESAA